MSRDVSVLADKTFDVVIIGGGVTGAWLALHCAQNGYSTALVERGDYASATSSASSKLLHGGIRYLQQLQFGKVRESAMERSAYVYAAPHLSTPVPFVIPTYQDFKKSKFFLNCGMMAYAALCIGENALIGSPEQRLPGARSITPAAMNAISDLSHDNHTGGVVFYERHMHDSERMVLAIIQTAQANGASAFNYVSATGLLGNAAKVEGIQARDEITGAAFDVKARLVVNAAGPWVDQMNATLRNAETAPRLTGFAVGSHIITRQISDHALALTTKHQSDATIDRGGRHIFAIPWRGYSLIGTSYEEVGTPDGPLNLQSAHVDELLEGVNEALPKAGLTRADVISGYSGLYPLQTDKIESKVYQGTGEYRIIDHAETNRVAGIVTALGAKFTTGRKVSALTLPLIAEKLSGSKDTTKTKLTGSDYKSYKGFLRAKLSEYGDTYSEEVITHLTRVYGSQIDAFLASIADKPALQKPISAKQPDLMGQIVWAIDHEQALTVSDILYRRTSLALLGMTQDEAGKVADLMAERLGWGDVTKTQQLSECTARMAHTRAAIAG
ncbi:MAG: glycerol-3-phosphate dehydrogenase/oxidase [Pseudomonadota bacterium]